MRQCCCCLGTQLPCSCSSPEGGAQSPPRCPSPLQDTSSQLLWWHAVVCDAAISAPGPDELAGREPARWWPRDRSVRLPWAALQAILEQVVALRGHRQRYIQEQFLLGIHHFNVGAAGVLSRGADELCQPAAAHADSGP